MNIRLATQNDVQTICALLNEFFEYNARQQPQYYAAHIESGGYPSAVIDSADGDIIVAEIDDTVIGFMHIKEDATSPYPSVHARKFANVVALFVTDKYRKKGIGHLILDKAKGWAKSRNLEYLELMVLENNDIGKSFYKRENFVAVSQTMHLEI